MLTVHVCAGLMLLAGAIARWGMPRFLSCAARAAPPRLLSQRGGLKEKVRTRTY